MTAAAGKRRGSDWNRLFRGGLFRGAKDSPFLDDAARRSAGRFAMWLFLVTLAVIFVSTILAYVIVRLSPVNADRWVPAGAGGLPGILGLSTALLLASSGTMHLGVLAARRGERTVGGWTAATLALGFAFLACQVIAWREASASGIRFDASLYAWTFYVLTGLHALHLFCGLPCLAVTVAQAYRGRYGPEDHAGLVLCAMYWHFLDGVWLVLYPILLWGSHR